jgi:hypothetical protein
MKIRNSLILGMAGPVAARSKRWVGGRSLAGNAGSNPNGGLDVCLLSAMCCQVQVSVTSWSLLQRGPTDCGVSQRDREVSII